MRNILISAAIAAVILSGCGDKKETNTLKEINKTAQNVLSDVKSGVSDAIEKADEAAQKIHEVKNDIAEQAEKTEKEAKEALEKATNTGKEILQKANNTINDAEKAADKIINENIKPTIDTAKQKAENIAEAAAAPVVNADKGKKLFTTCIPCHGTKAEKSAVNKSQIINKWSKEQILKALKGYKDGTYGGAFKATMTPTVKKLSDADMEELAAYIADLGK
ncbi:MAG: c-type cytochrome [Campylobacteraceae bacterium]|jgi:cytochrome c553|nr:c-type cytochrome [Campylobacteraceae bacterium]